MSAAGVGAFAAHEFRLASRDLLGVLGGRRSLRRRALGIAGFVAFAAFLHYVAYRLVAPSVRAGVGLDAPTLTVVGGAMLMSWCLLVSQAIESVTRAFYARGDLDLILSSPSRTQDLFAARIAAVAVAAAFMAMALATPLVDVLVVMDGPRWLAIHGVAAAMGASAGAVAVAGTALLFRLVGPAWTRTAAQIIAAVIGAAFAIALQTYAILSWGDPSRLAALTSRALDPYLPEYDSVLWLPARAALGDVGALAATMIAALAMIAVATMWVAPRFARLALSAAGAAAGPGAAVERARPFRAASAAGVLREKEWRLLRRDPWLMSQTLMQLLYLVPAVLLLWRAFADKTGALPMLVPVLVMAAGQLAGGLAWLAVSGEDAPDLVRTAPLRPAALVRAKVEAVLGAVGTIVAPLVLGIALVSPTVALVAAVSVAAASVSAAAIQLWFRAQARRSQFRRRQTSSRIATFAEAFSSILWACASGFAANGQWGYAGVVATVCGLVLLGVRAASPRAE